MKKNKYNYFPNPLNYCLYHSYVEWQPNMNNSVLLHQTITASEYKLGDIGYDALYSRHRYRILPPFNQLTKTVMKYRMGPKLYIISTLW